MTFKYGAGVSLYTEAKQHRDEQQWSPVVFFDRPRCILCYRCVRVCSEGMELRLRRGGPRRQQRDLAQRGRPPGMRGVRQLYRHLPGRRAHLRHLPLQDAAVGDESRLHRLHPLRRWLRNHAGSAQRQLRRGQSYAETTATAAGSMATSLCIKGRYAFDFASHPERLTKPLVRGADGRLQETSWE